MLKAILKTAVATTLLFSTVATASADEWRYRHRHFEGGGYRGGDAGGAIIGGLIGGMILGGIMAQPRYEAAPQPYYVDPDDVYVPVCRQYIVGQDYYGRPVIRRICQ